MRNEKSETGFDSAFRTPHSEFVVDNLAGTEAFGRRLGELLFPGAVVALVGPLGAGKTHLTRAVAEGLGVRNPAAVTSPTFVLIQEYPARLPIFHFDAYRLSGPREFLDLGVEEYYQAGGVCLIEWADRVAGALPAEHLCIEIESVSAHPPPCPPPEAGGGEEGFPPASDVAPSSPPPGFAGERHPSSPPPGFAGGGQGGGVTERRRFRLSAAGEAHRKLLQALAASPGRPAPP